MDAYYLTGTFNTPMVKYDPVTQLLEFEGRLIPENPEIFFSLIFELIEKIRDSGQREIRVRMQLFYYNTSSSRRLSLLFKNMKAMEEESGIKFVVLWEYDEDDEDSLDDGQHFAHMAGLNFEFIEINDDD